MVNGSFGLPVWGPGLFNITDKSFVDFQLSPPFTKRPKGLDITLVVERAENLLLAKNWREAIEILKPLKDEPLARRFLIEALNGMSNDTETVEVLWPPSTPEETVAVGAAILNLQNKERAKAFLQLEQVSKVTDASVVDIRRRISMRWSL
jgi:hypothetical protein